MKTGAWRMSPRPCRSILPGRVRRAHHPALLQDAQAPGRGQTPSPALAAHAAGSERYRLSHPSAGTGRDLRLSARLPPVFRTPQLYAENNQAYPDNGERFRLPGGGGPARLRAAGLCPDIAHCNDWHTGLLPLLLKTRHAHNPSSSAPGPSSASTTPPFQGVRSPAVLGRAEIADYERRINYDYGHVNLLKCGVLYADKINAVSPNYASELLTHLGLTAWPACSSSARPT